jgi:hypothetical protein
VFFSDFLSVFFCCLGVGNWLSKKEGLLEMRVMPAMEVCRRDAHFKLAAPELAHIGIRCHSSN